MIPLHRRLSALLRTDRGLGALTVIVAITVQVWIVSGGAWGRWSDFSTRYNDLATAFLHGRLSLDIQPSSALLALPDPYDPVANAPYREIDLSLYHGKYYMYWGPVPAVILAAGCRAFGIDNPKVGDEYLGSAFMFGTTLLATLLIFQIRARLFPNVPATTAAAAAFSLTLGTPVLFSLARVSVYETAIFSGQFFLLAGLCAAWFALKSSQPRPALLAISGTCSALSAASRVSLPPALAAAVALTLWHLWRRKESRAACIACLILPLLAGAVLLCWYNYARFGSILETGARYQLSPQVQTSLFASGFISFSHIVPNLCAYLLTLPHTSAVFPYLLTIDAEPWLKNLFTLWPDFRSEPLAGLLWTQTFLFVGLFGFGMSHKKSATPQLPQDDTLAKWLSRSLLAAGVLGLIPSLAMDGVTLRYLLDGLPCLSILAALGYFRLLDKLRNRPRAVREIRSAVRALVTIECLLGILLAVSRNPSNFYRIIHWFPIL